MSNNQSPKNTPTVWRQVKIGEVASVVSGGTPPTDDLSYWNGNIDWITPTEITKIKGKYILPGTGRKITESGLRDSSATIIPANSLILCSRATVGDCAINLKPITTNQGFKNLIPMDTILVDFLYYKICLSKNILRRLSSGSTFLEFSKKDIEKLKLLLPPLPEQKRIVSVLETWDEAVEKLARKIEVKRNIKKSLMQKLLTGKVRLPGFSERWHNVKLGQVGEIVTGNTPPMKDTENYGNEFCWATAEDFNSKYIRVTNIKLSEAGKFKSRFLPVGSILVTCIASLGKNAIAGVPLATNQQINSIIVGNENNNEFIYYTIENSAHLLRKIAGAGAMPILNKSSFANIKIKIPSLNEQNAIADILTKSDEEIGLLQEKLTKLKDQKKYLLNNLITGKIRTTEGI